MHESRTAVETGMEETAHARQSLEAIIESSKQVEHQINLIATAATEQTSASGEISESAGQISQLSNETAQGAEEAVEALKNLASLASDLDGMIRQFRLESDNQSGGTFTGTRGPRLNHSADGALLIHSCAQEPGPPRSFQRGGAMRWEIDGPGFVLHHLLDWLRSQSPADFQPFLSRPGGTPISSGSRTPLRRGPRLLRPVQPIPHFLSVPGISTLLHRRPALW